MRVYDCSQAPSERLTTEPPATGLMANLGSNRLEMVSVGRLIPATHRQVSSSRGMKLNNPLSRYDSQVSSDLGPEFSAADFGFFRVAEPVGGLAGFDSSPSPFCPA